MVLLGGTILASKAALVRETMGAVVARIPPTPVRRKGKPTMTSQIGIQRMTRTAKQIQLGATPCASAKQRGTSPI